MTLNLFHVAFAWFAFATAGWALSGHPGLAALTAIAAAVELWLAEAVRHSERSTPKDTPNA